MPEQAEVVPQRLTVTSAELAALLGVSEHSIRRLAASGKLPVRSIALGRRRVFSMRAVEQLLGVGQVPPRGSDMSRDIGPGRTGPREG